MFSTLSTSLGVILIYTTTTSAQETTRRAMTTDDGLNMVNVSNTMISPDGEWVFFSKSELDWKENKRKTTHHMAPASGEASFQYIGDAGGRSFQFSPRGTFVSFTRAVEEKNQLLVMRAAGGEAVQLSEHKPAVGRYVWAPDESAIYFVADEPRSEEEEARHKAGYDGVFIDEGANGQRAGAWQNLWRIDIASKEETRLTQGERRIASFDVAPDQSRLVYIERTENRRNLGNHAEIYLFDVATSEATKLTNNDAPESSVLWAPDGLHIVYEAPSNDGWDLRLDKLWVMNVDTRETRLISGNFQGNISNTTWTPDGSSLLFTGLQRTTSNLFRLSVVSGALDQLTDESGTLRVGGFSKDRNQIVYTFQDFDTPPDVFTSNINRFQPTRITALNPWIETDLILAHADVIQWNSSDGTEIEGILSVPTGHTEGVQHPFLLHIHGGPAGVFTNSFRASNHVWAGLGYAQLFPNVRGSSGYDDDLLQGNMNDLGGGDYADLMTGVDHAIRSGIADPQQLGVRGWSYGGILGGWTITQTDRFKGASIGAMVSDWSSEYGPGFNFDVRNWYIGGTPWENTERYREMSPLTHVANVTTPTLLLHGLNDRTDTEQQSMMFFQALKDQGKTARYIQFPREPHGFREPRHRRTRDIEEIRWMQQHVRGIEWIPWEREDEEKEKKNPTVADISSDTLH